MKFPRLQNECVVLLGVTFVRSFQSFAYDAHLFVNSIRTTITAITQDISQNFNIPKFIDHLFLLNCGNYFGK